MKKAILLFLVGFFAGLLVLCPQFAVTSKGESSCSGSQESPKKSDDKGSGVGISIDLGQVFDKAQKKTEEEDPFKEPVKKQVLSGPTYIKDNTEKHCHCQGGRVIIIMGNFEDPSIARSMEWARSLYYGSMKDTHLHVIAFSANYKSDPSFDAFYVPDKSRKGWKQVTHVTYGKDRISIAQDWNKNQILPPCCCFYEEVMIMFHGDLPGCWTRMIDYFPRLLNRKPVEKVVLWSCKSSQLFFPKAMKSKERDYYERICQIFAPKACSCGCANEKCHAISADGGDRKCPTGNDPTAILTAGSFEGKSTSLQMKCTTLENPLTSPDGTLREVLVHPDGKITASPTGKGVKVFGNNTCGTTKAEDCPKAKFKIETGEAFVDSVHMGESVISDKPLKELDYVGPKGCPICPSDEGCLEGQRPESLKGRTM